MSDTFSANQAGLFLYKYLTLDEVEYVVVAVKKLYWDGQIRGESMYMPSVQFYDLIDQLKLQPPRQIVYVNSADNLTIPEGHIPEPPPVPYEE